MDLQGAAFSRIQGCFVPSLVKIAHLSFSGSIQISFKMRVIHGTFYLYYQRADNPTLGHYLLPVTNEEK